MLSFINIKIYQKIEIFIEKEKDSEIEVSNRYSEIITYMYALLSTKFQANKLNKSFV